MDNDDKIKILITKVHLLEHKVNKLEAENKEFKQILKNDVYLKNDIDSARRLVSLLKSNL